MLIEMMTIAAILVLLNKKKVEKAIASSPEGCSVYGQPGLYFTWEELTKTAAPFPNNPSGPQCSNLKRLASDVLDPLRYLTGAPIYVNSAFRSVAVNNWLIATGRDAAPDSRHLEGKAADIYSNKYNPGELLDLMDERGIEYRWAKAYPTHLHIDIS